MSEPELLDLQSALERHGWSVQRKPSEEWWAYEVWLSTSVWSPVGTSAFVTPLIDPGDDSRAAELKEARTIFAVNVGTREPEGWMGPNVIHVRPRWRERIAEIVAVADTIRAVALSTRPELEP